MANQISDVGFMSPYSGDMAEIQRRKALAQALQQQGQEPLQAQPTPSGGFAVPISPWQGIAKLAQAGMGAYGQQQAGNMQRELAKRMMSDRSTATNAAVGALNPPPIMPAQSIEPNPEAGGDFTPMQTTELPEVKGRPDIAAAIKAMSGVDPQFGDAMVKAQLAQILKQGDPYTLGPGAVRMGAGNTPVASAPFKPESGFTLTPGSTRFGPSGAPIANIPPTPPAPKETDYNKPFLPDGSPNTAYQDYATRQKNAGATRVSVNNLAESGYAKAAGPGAYKMDESQYETADAASKDISKIDYLLNHLKKSDAITGMGAEVFLNLERARKLLLGKQAGGGTVSDTELLDTLLGSEVFPMIKQLGIGARGLDTPAEREFLRQVMTGTITRNKDTLVRMAEIRRNVAKRSIDRWNERVKAGEVDRFFEQTRNKKQTFDVPQGNEPATPQRRASDRASTPSTNAKGWTLHTDAKGNRAYVSPDGKQFEQVQ